MEQLAQMREDGADFVLIDVREPHEVEICAIGGRLIPLGDRPHCLRWRGEKTGLRRR